VGVHDKKLSFSSFKILYEVQVVVVMYKWKNFKIVKGRWEEKKNSYSTEKTVGLVCFRLGWVIL
jgi:hypothetical protein